MNKIVVPKLAVTIIDRKNENKALKILQKNKVDCNFSVYGMGTASSSVLSYFGLDDIKKMVLLSVIPGNIEIKILYDLYTKLEMHEPGSGISFTIGMNASSRYCSNIYAKEIDRKESYVMKQDKKYELIIAIMEEGYSEIVIAASRKVGASGGTLLHGKGLGAKEATKFLGITIEPDKDIMLILTAKEDSSKVMEAITKEAGLSTPGRGICFSLPVDNVAGLMENVVFEKID